MADSLNVISQIESYLQKEDTKKSLVVMTCGISGSGKSSLAHAIISNTVFTASTIPGTKYEDYQEEARALLVEQLPRVLREGYDVVLDLSLWSKAARDDYKEIIERNGGRWLLIYFDAEREVLWSRIQKRKAEGLNADAAFDVTEAVLDRYIAGFEKPSGEGEIVLKVS